MGQKRCLELLEAIFRQNPWISDQTVDADTARLDMELVLGKSRELLTESQEAEDEHAGISTQLRRMARAAL